MNFLRSFRGLGKGVAPKLDDGVRIYAIGDIHGRLDLLEALLTKIEAEETDSKKRLVFLGDYIDRGPESRGVIDLLIAEQNKRPDTVFLKGNHEQALLDFLDDPMAGDAWLDWGGEETVVSYVVDYAPTRPPQAVADTLKDRLPETHIRFLEGLDTSYTNGDYFFVHAGVLPGVPLEEQSAKDLLWIRREFHETPKDKRPSKVIVHGHHPTDQPLDAGWRIGVDTGAVWTDKLTAVVLEGQDRRFVSTID
ncbi:MAG: metallophosphoesterase family protein [Pseudomonadota bacterium]